jgi:HD superfamily phosphohydrolase
LKPLEFQCGFALTLREAMSNNSSYHRDRVFRDPEHGLIPVSARNGFVNDLIDTPEFQRLHRVRQLGVASLTFPGADHSRFCHSLGVFHLANRILEVLERRYPDGPVHNLIGQHHLTIKAAALLHDLGHGPFSHLMERAFASSKDHEERTKDMITSESGEIGAKLHDHGIKPEEVRRVIDHKFPYLFLQDIVSSQLDADRMDYLVRDSHFAGVDYGIFDLEWILHSVCVGSYSHKREASKLRLCLESKRGLQVAEQLILARQHMSLQVYYHKSTRRWEAVFLCLIREACRLADTDDLPAQTAELVRIYLRSRGKVNHGEFLRLDEPLMIHAFTTWRDACGDGQGWLAALSAGFLDRKKVLVRVDLPEDISGDLEAVLRQRMESELADYGTSHWELDSGEFTPYKGSHPDARRSDPKGYRDNVLANSILLSNGDPSTQAAPVAEISGIFRTLLGERFRLRRLYCNPDLKSRIDKIVFEVMNSPEPQPELVLPQ